MKIIFLDFDGVMNRWITIDNECDRPELWSSDAVKALNFILEKTKARIVISSSWRIGRSLDHLCGMLEAMGVDLYMFERPIKELRDANITIMRQNYEKYVYKTVIDTTPYQKDSRDHRGKVIQRWLNAHPEVTRWVILDDDTDMGDMMRYLIKTDSHEGLTMNHAHQAIEALNVE